MARPRCQNGIPRVSHSEALLRRGVATVHNEKFFWIFVFEHLLFVHRLFRDPNKGLMGVQIRMKLSENRIVPHHLNEIHKCDNCFPTKSGVFMFD